MIKFREKSYSKISTWIKENPGLPISLASLGLAAANIITNRKKLEESRIYQEEQLKTMKNLTRSLNKVDSSIKNDLDLNNKNKSKNKKSGSFIFKIKKKN